MIRIRGMGCLSVCPMDVFDLVEMAECNSETKVVPTGKGGCIMYMACVKGCPEQAISFEES